MESEIRVLDLFSGIGGFSLGLERAGPFRTVAFCEREPFPQAVLRKHWPEVPIYDDVRTIPTNELERIDLICGGFPCQPWSVAGEQRGAEDDRDLWPVMASLIEKLRPRWVVGENVRGFVNEPLGLQRSLSDLESIGYQCVTFILPACATGAPHRRDRVWIVGNASDERRNRRSQKAGREGSQNFAEQSQTGFRSEPGGPSSYVADAERRGRQGSRQPVNAINPTAATVGEAVEPVDGGFREIGCAQPGMGGVADGVSPWLDEPDIGRVATGVKNRSRRLKALGNAVVPQVVEQIGKAILNGTIK